MYHNGLWYVASCERYTGEDGKRHGRTLILHRFLTNAGKNTHVDHFDHNPLNNKKGNLRVTTDEKNTKHRKGRNKNNNSGYRNVSWNKWKEQWVVQLSIDGKNTQLGWFDEVDEAGKFAEIKRREIYGEFAGNG